MSAPESEPEVVAFGAAPEDIPFEEGDGTVDETDPEE